MSVKTGNGPIAFAGGISTPDFFIPLATGDQTLTNELQADGFMGANNGFIYKADLSGVSQVRLTGRVKTVSASANSPKIQLRTSGTTFTTTVASFLQLGESSVEFSVFTGATLGDSGWINLAAAYRSADIFLGLMSIGGDGAADPVVSNIMAHFR